MTGYTAVSIEASGHNVRLVWIVGNFTRENMAAMMAQNPHVFPTDVAWRFRPLLKWRSRARFFAWLKRSQKCSGWTFVGDLKNDGG